MIYKTGATSISVDIQIVDDSGLPVTGLVAATFPTLTYSRSGANADVSFPALSDLAAITTAYISGGVKERGNGVYRLDLPNGVFTTAGELKIRGEATGKHVLCPWIDVGAIIASVIGAVGSVTTIGGGAITISSFDATVWQGLGINTIALTGNTPTIDGPVVIQGIFAFAGFYSFFPYYKISGQEAYIWQDNDGRWVVSNILGTQGSAYFKTTAYANPPLIYNLDDPYSPQGTASGTVDAVYLANRYVDLSFIKGYATTFSGKANDAGPVHIGTYVGNETAPVAVDGSGNVSILGLQTFLLQNDVYAGGMAITASTVNSITFIIPASGTLTGSAGQQIVVRNNNTGIIYSPQMNSIDNTIPSSPVVTILGTWPVTPATDGSWVVLCTAITGGNLVTGGGI